MCVGAPHDWHATGTHRPDFCPCLNQSAADLMKSAGDVASVVSSMLAPCSSKVTTAPGPGLAAHVNPARCSAALERSQSSASVFARVAAVDRSLLRILSSVPGTIGEVKRQSFCPKLRSLIC